ncbi:hypothetical protein Tco_0100338, partial [Tanacetum coccineum]
MEEKYCKFINMIKEVRINVPLVHVLAGMPNYGRFLKELVRNTNKLKEISTAFLNEECSAIIQNKIPPKLGDPKSFLILCTLGNTITCNGLADLGASINLMPYSLYAKLSGGKELNLKVGNERINFMINKAMQHSYSNDDMCFNIDVIDKVTKEELDALLNDSNPFMSTSEKINETDLDREFAKFMEVKF